MVINFQVNVIAEVPDGTDVEHASLGDFAQIIPRQDKYVNIVSYETTTSEDITDDGDE